MVFNYKLLRRMIELSGRPMYKVLKEAGVPRTSWVEWLESDKVCLAGNIPATALVSVANALCMPLKYLFKPEDEEADIFPAGGDLFLHRKDFRPNRFDHAMFIASFGKKSPVKLATEQMIRRLGVSWSTFTNWVKDASFVRMGHLLLLCSEFGYNLDDYIIDPNPSHATRAPQKEEASVPATEQQAADEVAKLKKKLADAQSANRRLKKDNERLQQDNIRLTGEAMELGRANELLRQRVRNLEAEPYRIDVDGDVARLVADRAGNDDDDGSGCV